MKIPLVYLLGGLLLGWSIGGMDFSLLFGPAIASKMVRYRTGVIIGIICCFAGAYLQGGSGIATLSTLTTLNLKSAIIASVTAALLITALNLFKLPVPTSQAVAGTILGVGLFTHNLNPQTLFKILICWISSPIVAFFIAVPLYIIVGKIYNALHLNIFQRDLFLRVGLILGGCYAAYALGANGTANIGAVFAGAGAITPKEAALFGAIAIALGILTFSKRMVGTIGKGIVKLNAYSAMISVLAEAITVHIFAMIGVPVSMSQALIAAIIGIGEIRGFKSIRIRKVAHIFASWFIVPIVATGLSYCICYLYKV